MQQWKSKTVTNVNLFDLPMRAFIARYATRDLEESDKITETAPEFADISWLPDSELF